MLVPSSPLLVSHTIFITLITIITFFKLFLFSGHYNTSNGQNNTRHKLSILIKPKNITVGVSESASFDCIPSEKNAKVLWLKRGEEIKSNPSPYRLVFETTSADDEGWYTCKVSNNFATVSQKAFLNVKDKVSLTLRWPDRQEVMHNQPLILNAVAKYGQIQWYYNGKPIKLSFRNGRHGNVYNIKRKLTQDGSEIVSDNQTLTVNGESRSGTYQVLATGFNEQVSKHTEVTSYNCGEALTNSSGSLSTPNFPGFYPANITCLWLITPQSKPKQGTLNVEIHDFHVGCKDRLVIYDGSTSSSQMLGSLGSRTPRIFTSHLSAFRLVFNSCDSCNKSCKGFNATYWISVPTPTTKEFTNTSPTTKEIANTSPTKRTTKGQMPQSTTKMNTDERPTHMEETSTENTATAGKSNSSKNSTVIYAVVVSCCVAILMIALLVVMKRKGYLILTCIKGNDNGNRREGNQGQERELNEYPSRCEIILYDSPGEKDAVQPANEIQDGPVYDVLEGPGEDQGCDRPDQSANVYATVNEGCVVEDHPTSPLGNFEVSFLEEIYTTLTADRDNEDVNIYESLRTEKSGNERPDGWSVEGMQSSDQDYVSIVT